MRYFKFLLGLNIFRRYKIDWKTICRSNDKYRNGAKELFLNSLSTNRLNLCSKMEGGKRIVPIAWRHRRMMAFARGRTPSFTPKNCLATNMRSYSSGYCFADSLLLADGDKGLL